MGDRAGRSAAAVAGGAAVAAVAGVLFLAVSARSLTTEQNTVFLTYWAALFAIFAVLSGVQSEMTRAVRADREARVGQPGRTSPLFAGLLVGAVVSIVVLALFPLWDVVLRGIGDTGAAVLLMAIASILYAGHVSTVGTLAGSGRWYGFSGLNAGEGLVRLVLALLAGWVGASLLGFQVAAAAGAITWLLVTLTLPTWRPLWRLRIDAPLGALLHRTLNSMAAAGGSALLVTGFPLLMSITTDPAEYARAAPFIVAVSVTRAPLLIPVTAFQSMVIAAFVARPERAGATLARLVGAVVLVAVAGGALAAVLGPWAMTSVFGQDYGNSPLTLSLLVVAGAFLALLVLGGSVALALDAHSVNTLGWYVALGVSVLLMLLPTGLETRAILALAVGPLAGAAIHLTYVVRALRRRAAEVV